MTLRVTDTATTVPVVLLDDKARQSIVSALILPALLWLVNGVYLAWLARFGPWPFWLADITQWIIIPGVTALYLARRHDIRPRDYGFHPGAWSRGALLGQALLAFAVIGISFVAVHKLVWALLGYPRGFFSYPGVFPSGTSRVFFTAYSALSAGLVESTFFIGLPWLYYQNRFKNKSRLPFIVVTSCFFALAHWEQGPHTVASALVSNLLACQLYFRFGNLWAIAIGHALLDMILFR